MLLAILATAAGLAAVIASGPASAQPAATDFVSTWKTTPTVRTITLPLYAAGEYDFLINWGDTQAWQEVTAWDDPDARHTFAADGTYTVTIRFPGADSRLVGWQCNFSLSCQLITGISQWGGRFNLGNNGFSFAGADSLEVTASDSPDLTQTTNLSNAFASAAMLTQLGTWDTSNVTDMSGMFSGASNFTQNIGAWNTSNVTTMSGMFFGAQRFNHDIGRWDTGKVTDMASMFFGATAFNQNLGTWNIGRTTTMADMLTRAGLSDDTYSSTLIGWSTQTAASPRRLDATARYRHWATEARDALLGRGWRINDGGPNQDFVSTWRPGRTGQTAQLPLQPNGVYDFEINWGAPRGNASPVSTTCTPPTHSPGSVRGP